MTVELLPLPNVLGFLALFCYILTLLPTNLRIVVPASKKTKIPKRLLQNRRLIGVIAFFLALLHGWLLIRKQNFDYLDAKTYWVYFQGVSSFIIFTLLAITSNDWSVKRLKKNWRKLHRLTYLAMFLVTWHVWAKMAEHWSYFTLISLLSLGVVILLYLKRRYLEYQTKPVKTQPKTSPRTSLSETRTRV